MEGTHRSVRLLATYCLGREPNSLHARRLVTFRKNTWLNQRTPEGTRDTRKWARLRSFMEWPWRNIRLQGESARGWIPFRRGNHNFITGHNRQVQSNERLKTHRPGTSTDDERIPNPTQQQNSDHLLCTQLLLSLQQPSSLFGDRLTYEWKLPSVWSLSEKRGGKHN